MGGLKERLSRIIRNKKVSHGPNLGEQSNESQDKAVAQIEKTLTTKKNFLSKNDNVQKLMKENGVGP